MIKQKQIFLGRNNHYVKYMIDYTSCVERIHNFTQVATIRNCYNPEGQYICML